MAHQGSPEAVCSESIADMKVPRNGPAAAWMSIAVGLATIGMGDRVCAASVRSVGSDERPREHVRAVATRRPVE